MGHAVQERTREHIPCSCQIFGLASEGGYVRFLSFVVDEGSVRAIGYHAMGDQLFQPLERGRAAGGLRDCHRLGGIAEEQVAALQSFMQRIAEDLWDEGIRASDRDLGSRCFGALDSLADGMLAGCWVGKHVAFYEEPFGIGDTSSVDMFCGQVARDGQARTHGPFGIRGDEGETGTGWFTDDDRVANIDF